MSDEEINAMGSDHGADFFNQVEELSREECEARERSEGDYQQDEESDNNLEN